MTMKTIRDGRSLVGAGTRRACVLALVASSALLATSCSATVPYGSRVNIVSAAVPALSKLDLVLREWITGADARSVPVLIQTRTGKAADVARRLRASGVPVRVSSMPDLLIADLSRDALAVAAQDADVTRLSSDAPVLGTGVGPVTGKKALSDDGPIL